MQKAEHSESAQSAEKRWGCKMDGRLFGKAVIVFWFLTMLLCLSYWVIG